MENEDIKKEAKEDSKKIKLLIEQGKLEDAKKLAEKYPDDFVIQSQRITIAIMQNDLETAKKIAYRPEFKAKNTIYSQKIKIALLENNLNEAERLIKKAKKMPNFMDARILASFEKSLKQQFKRAFLEKIRNGEIVQTDIDKVKGSRYLDNYYKACLLLAYCDKTQNISVAKRIYRKYQETNPSSDKLSNIRKIMQSVLNTRTKIFQYDFYEVMLGLKKVPKKKKDIDFFDKM